MCVCEREGEGEGEGEGEREMKAFIRRVIVFRARSCQGGKAGLRVLSI